MLSYKKKLEQVVVYSLLQSKTCSFEEHGCNPVRSHASCYHKRTLGAKICGKNVYLLLIFPHVPLFPAKNTNSHLQNNIDYFISSHPHPDILLWHSIWHPFCINFLHSIWHIFWHSFWQSIWHIFWHSFWHSIWHIFWHSFWHSIWHIFWHSMEFYLSYILTFYGILSYIYSDILWHSILHIFWHSMAFYLTYVLTFYGILSYIYSDILWHSIWHMFWHFIWHSFWYSIWHKTWHSTGHFIWHLFWHSLWHRVWHSLCHVFGSRPSPLAHCIRSWWYAVRVQTWPTASEAGRKTGVIRRGAREKESRR